MNSCRLIIDTPATGSWNMAVDQALMVTTDTSAQSTLRLYSWTPHTLSLGYFQKHDNRQSHRESLACNWVRRSTGGGAILHHHELTYSLCVPSKSRWSKKNSELYDVIHHATIDALRHWNIEANLYQNSQSRASNNSNPFLCFQRRTPGDVILQSFKIGGSAQRRTRNALLQHGSILFAKSVHAPQLPGINDLAGCQVNQQDFTEAWIESVNERLQFNLSPEQLSEKERLAAQQIEANRFSADSWNKKR